MSISGPHATREDRGRSLDVLSSRELQVLELLASGSTNGEIADLLGLSVHAVKFHLAAVYRKLGVTNRTEAAVVYVNANGRSAVKDGG